MRYLLLLSLLTVGCQSNHSVYVAFTTWTFSVTCKYETTPSTVEKADGRVHTFAESR